MSLLSLNVIDMRARGEWVNQTPEASKASTSRISHINLGTRARSVFAYKLQRCEGRYYN